MCLTAGQTSDHIGAKILYPCLPDDSQAVLIADRGYDSDEYRAALEAKGITPCIPPRKKRKAPATYCKTQYKQRHKIENMFGKLDTSNNANFVYFSLMFGVRSAWARSCAPIFRRFVWV